jgi:cytochrome c553
MFKDFLSPIFGAVIVFAIGVIPATAADDIETKVQVCAACHGQNGEPADPKTTPIIWGQQASYLFKELHDYQSGARDNPIMSPVAKGLSLPDLRQIATYFAAKSWPAGHAAATAAADTAAGTSSPEGSAMCKACHGQNFEGGAPAPRLAGLSYEYLLGAMQSFADDKRTNNLDMPGFMKALTESQREAIAHYLSAL